MSENSYAKRQRIFFGCPCNNPLNTFLFHTFQLLFRIANQFLGFVFVFSAVEYTKHVEHVVVR